MELQIRNVEVQKNRKDAQNEFIDKVLRNSPLKSSSSSPGKITSKTDVFFLLKSNGWIKKKIIEMIKHLKDISKKMRESKKQYAKAKEKIDQRNQ